MHDIFVMTIEGFAVIGTVTVVLAALIGAGATVGVLISALLNIFESP